MHITELLSIPELRDALKRQYRDGISAAVQGYADSAADEDSVTGALGQALRGGGVVDIGAGKCVKWITRYRKLRGRGKNAPEKEWGADGLFEVETIDDSGILSRKTLPFQAKNNSPKYGNSDLIKQAKKIAAFPGGGIVVNYKPNGYVAVDARFVANRDDAGNHESPLADKLSEEFLLCKIGSPSYIFEPAVKGFRSLQGEVLQHQRWTPAHRVRTTLAIRETQVRKRRR